jgi:hypothetical protein
VTTISTISTISLMMTCTAEHAHPRAISAWRGNHWGIENAVHWVCDVTFNGIGREFLPQRVITPFTDQLGGPL